MQLEQHAQQRSRGFSLIEVVVVLAVSSIIMAALYQTFHAQQRTYRRQSEMAAMQQNLRAATYLLTMDLRGAGYDPLFTQRFGFVTKFPPPFNTFVIDYTKNQCDATVAIMPTAGACIIAFTVDDKEDGRPDNLTPDKLGNLVADPTIEEYVAYRFNAKDRVLERFDVHDLGFPAGTWKAVVDRVDAVNFVYRDDAGKITTDPKDFHAVEVSVLLRSDSKDMAYTNTQIYTNKSGANICPTCTSDHYRRRLWNTEVQVRNPQFRNPLGFESL